MATDTRKGAAGVRAGAPLRDPAARLGAGAPGSPRGPGGLESRRSDRRRRDRRIGGQDHARAERRREGLEERRAPGFGRRRWPNRRART